MERARPIQLLFFQRQKSTFLANLALLRKNSPIAYSQRDSITTKRGPRPQARTAQTKCFFGALVARPTQTSLDRPLRIQQPTERRYLQNGDDLDLDQRALRQSRHLKRTACGIRGLEMARIHLVNRSKVVDVS